MPSRPPKGRRTIAGVSLALLALLAAALVVLQDRRGERIVLITLDTLRYDAFAGAGDRSPAMPELRRWAAEATVFERCYSATSTTQPSHASMFTGLHPWQHGVTRNGQKLAPEHTTVAESLRAAGFTTAAVVASFPVSAAFGFDQGFQHFDDDFVRGSVSEDWQPTEEDEDGGGASTRKPFYSLSATITERAIASLDRAEGRRQLFWFHYFDAHDPYGDSRKGRRIGPKKARKLAAAGKDPTEALRLAHELYDLDVAFLDHQLGQLLARLERDARRFRTHVVVAADHGESFGEDGSTGHGTRLTPGQIHVPCIVRSPELPPGTRRDVAGSIDVGTTLLSLAGIEGSLPAGRDLTVVPRRPTRAFGMRRIYGRGQTVRRIDGKEYPVDEPLFCLVSEDGTIYRGNSERVLWSEGAEESRNEDLEERLKRLFETFEAELDGSFEAEQLEPEAAEALRALGYLG
jgi:arylsulfatase